MDNYRNIYTANIHYKYIGRPKITCTHSYCDWCDQDTTDLVVYKAYYHNGTPIDWINTYTDLVGNSRIGICNSCCQKWINYFKDGMERDVAKILQTSRQEIEDKLPPELVEHIWSYI